MDTSTKHLLRPIRGCATDEQYRETAERVETALKYSARHKVKWAVDLLREAAAIMNANDAMAAAQPQLIADMKKCVEELD